MTIESLSEDLSTLTIFIHADYMLCASLKKYLSTGFRVTLTHKHKIDRFNYLLILFTCQLLQLTFLILKHQIRIHHLPRKVNSINLFHLHHPLHPASLALHPMHSNRRIS